MNGRNYALLGSVGLSSYYSEVNSNNAHIEDNDAIFGRFKPDVGQLDVVR